MTIQKTRAQEILEGAALTQEELQALRLSAVDGNVISNRHHPLWETANTLVEAGLLHNSGETTPEGDALLARL